MDFFTYILSNQLVKNWVKLKLMIKFQLIVGPLPKKVNFTGSHNLYHPFMSETIRNVFKSAYTGLCTTSPHVHQAPGSLHSILTAWGPPEHYHLPLNLQKKKEHVFSQGKTASEMLLAPSTFFGGAFFFPETEFFCVALAVL